MNNNSNIKIELLDREPVSFNKAGEPVSFFDEDVWDFSNEQSVKFGGLVEISFRRVESRFKDDIKSLVKLVWEQKKRSIAISQLKNYAVSFHDIAKHSNSSKWERLNSDMAYKEFIRNLDEVGYSKTTLEQISVSLRFLYDNGIINRFVDTKGEFGSLIKKASSKSKQHIAIPEYIAKSLFGEAINIVETYYPYRHEVSDGYKRYFQAYRGYSATRTNHSRNFAKSVGKHIKANVPIDGFKLCGEARSAINIQTACLLVVVGFSGARLSESLSFSHKSYHEVKFKDIVVPIINGWTSKANRKGIPYKASWVTHPIVKKALELAYDSSEYAREIHHQRISLMKESGIKQKLEKELESSFISLSINKQTRHVISKSTGERFHRFMVNHSIVASDKDVDEFNILNSSRSGELVVGKYLPKLSPHDFRRTFAVFVVRNKLCNLISLKYQYKHLNLSMTAWYSNNANLAALLDMEMDKDLQKEIELANEEINTETLYHIFNDNEILSGKEGQRIMAERESNQSNIYMSRDEIRARIRNGTLSIVEHPTGYCTNPSCDRICASEKSTETCHHEIITREKVMIRVSNRDKLIKKFTALNTNQFYMASILKNIETEIKAIEKLMSEHHIKFEPFNGHIIALTMKSN